MRLYYEETGKGQPLILLHGNGEDSTYFKHQISYFSRRYRVIAVDTRGHGRSPRGSGPFTLYRFASDLRHLLDRLHLRRVILLGFSDGGNIALIFALRYPEYVDRMILNGANLSPFGVKASVQLPTVLEYSLLCAENRLLRLAGKKQESRTAREEMLSLMVREPWIRARYLERIAVPVLVIAGTEDMIRGEHTAKIAASIPHSRLRILPGTHFIAAEDPDAFNRETERFLRDTEGDVIRRMKRLWGRRHPEAADRGRMASAAVLVPLIRKDGEYHLLFEERAEKLASQPGEICFPGGMAEDGETMREAAIRETQEELLLDRDRISVIAPMDVLFTPSGLTVYPFLAVLNGYEGTFSPEETKRVFTVPLRWFLDHRPEKRTVRIVTEPGEDFPYDLVPGGRQYPWRTGQYDVYFYRHEEGVIWGMTAKMVRSFAELYRGEILR